MKLASCPENIRAAIASARLMSGMTRKQVFMAVGYPVSNETPSLSAARLRLWKEKLVGYRFRSAPRSGCVSTYQKAPAAF
jgi:hypothetical protein